MAPALPQLADNRFEQPTTVPNALRVWSGVQFWFSSLKKPERRGAGGAGGAGGAAG
jgi:hypothetical protein